MSYGFIARNSSGDVVIDDQYRNFQQLFMQQRSVNFTAYQSVTQAFPAVAVSFPQTVTTTLPPLIGLRAISNRIGVGGFIGSPGAWTGLYLLTDIYGGISPGQSRTCTFEMAAFVDAGHVQLARPGNYGMQIFDAGGGVIFDSRVPPLIVENSVSYATPGVGASLESIESHINVQKVALGSGQMIDAGTLGFLAGYTDVTPNRTIHIRCKLMTGPGGSGNKVALYPTLQIVANQAVPYPSGTFERLGTQSGMTTRSLVIKRPT